jgi:hypothetical protein
MSDDRAKEKATGLTPSMHSKNAQRDRTSESGALQFSSQQWLNAPVNGPSLSPSPPPAHPNPRGSDLAPHPKKKHRFPFHFNQRLPFPVEISYRPVRARAHYVPDQQYSVIRLDNGTTLKCYSNEPDIQDVLIPPPNVDPTIGTRAQGLTSADATDKLVRDASELLASYKNTHKVSLLHFLRLPEVLVVSVCIMVLLFCVVYQMIALSTFSLHHVIDIFIHIALLTLLLIGSAFLYLREKWLDASELEERIEDVIATVKESGLNCVQVLILLLFLCVNYVTQCSPQKINIPPAASVSLSRVVRDGVVRVVPSTLLVEGDIVEMLYGENAPCRMKYVYVGKNNGPVLSDDESMTSINTTDAPPPDRRKDYILEANSVLQPALFGMPPDPLLKSESLISHGRFQFMVLETPLLKNISQACTIRRPASLFHSQCAVWRRFITFRVLPAVFIVSVIVNAAVFGVNYSQITASSTKIMSADIAWIYYFFLAQVNCVIASLPLIFPLIWLIIRSYGNALILTLFEALQNSKTDFEDKANVDEFDEEAPPPIKELALDRRMSLLPNLLLMLYKEFLYRGHLFHFFQILGSRQ